MNTLRFECEACADLVGGLVKFLGIERSTKTKGSTRSENNVVSNGGNTTVIDLDL
jgi:hypothetical protein